LFTLSQTRRITKILSYTYLAVLLILVFFPIIWMISSSVKPIEDLFIIPPQWIPKNPTLSTMNSVIFGDYGRGSMFPQYFKNSIIVTFGTTVLCLFVATLAAYALSRFPFRGSHGLMVGILSTQMFPQGMLLITLYLTFMKLNMLNKYPSLILANTTFAIPFAIWILKGFFDTIPKDIEEAALMDGCGRIGAMTKVVMPMIIPGLVAAGVYTFLISWDEYLFASMLTIKPEMRTLPPGIIQSFVGQFYLNWPNVMAASVLVTIPVTILFILFQKYLVQGLTAGAVKG
jgi:multiple sugar transport system permease protein